MCPRRPPRPGTPKMCPRQTGGPGAGPTWAHFAAQGRRGHIPKCAHVGPPPRALPKCAHVKTRFTVGTFHFHSIRRGHILKMCPRGPWGYRGHIFGRAENVPPVNRVSGLPGAAARAAPRGKCAHVLPPEKHYPNVPTSEMCPRSPCAPEPRRKCAHEALPGNVPTVSFGRAL